MRMQNKRHKYNPANDNKELFELLHINHVYPAWHTKCDYYLKRSDFKKQGFVLSRTKLKYKIQMGITIKPGQEWVIPIFEEIDFNKYPYQSIAQWTLSAACVQRAFNERRVEMGL